MEMTQRYQEMKENNKNETTEAPSVIQQINEYYEHDFQA